MRDADETLRELRRLFRDEVEDALGPLDDARAALSDGGAAGAHAGAVDEVFRIVHSLKGAARAVAWPSIERFCHVLETRLGAAREGHVKLAAGHTQPGLANRHRG